MRSVAATGLAFMGLAVWGGGALVTFAQSIPIELGTWRESQCSGLRNMESTQFVSYAFCYHCYTSFFQKGETSQL